MIVPVIDEWILQWNSYSPAGKADYRWARELAEESPA